MIIEDKKKLDLIAQAIYDKKGFNILALDLRGISSMTDYVIIAEGSVDRHVKSLATSIRHQLGSVKITPYQVDGEKDAEWVVMDYGDVMIHLFIPDVREKYNLEELWNKAKIVDLDIVVDKQE